MTNQNNKPLPSQNPLFNGLSRVKLQYMDMFHNILQAQEKKFDIEEILIQFNSKPQTVKKYLKEFLDKRPSEISRIIGFYPSAETVIRLAEAELGLVSGHNLSDINQHCKNTIDAITKPKHKQFLESILNDYLEPDGKTVRVDKDILGNLLYEDYVDFVHEADNGLVSIAGSMNEKILIRGLENSGLVLGVDLRKTGTQSEGDLQVEHRGRTTRIMFCEVKSYAARERLLRGIQDIPHPEKVGVGFFNNAAEFNPDRTQTLLAAGPLAIYMPDPTYGELNQASKVQTTRNQDKLYRPLSMFINDMVYFRDNGNLPHYR